MSENISRIAKNLRFLRSAIGLSRKDFCEKFDINYGRYTRYEDGSADVPSDILIRLTEYYDISADDILKKDLYRTALKINTDEDREEEEDSISKIQEQMQDLAHRLEELAKKKLISRDNTITNIITS